MDQDDPQAAARFFALIETELGAQAARLLPADGAPPEATNTVWHRLADGRIVVAIFAEPPADPRVIARRLSVLSDAIAAPPGLSVHTSRVSVARSLKDELIALTRRAVALDALVIDADSPVVWGSASGTLRRPVLPDYSSAMLSLSEPSHDWNDSDESAKILPDDRDDARSGEHAPVAQNEDADPDELVHSEEVAAMVERALAHVRGLGALEGLAKGKPLRHHHVEDSFAVAACSFSSIYLLLLVYSSSFDELRAERALHEALPRIEELVSALPPLDPEPAPMAGVVRIGRKRR